MTNQNNQDKQAFEIGWDFIQLGYSIMPEQTQFLFDLTMNLGMAKIMDTMRDLGIDLPFPGEDNEGADERDERDEEQTGEKPVAAWLDEFLNSREDTPDGEETDDDEEDDEPGNLMVSVREGDRWGTWQPVRSANARRSCPTQGRGSCRPRSAARRQRTPAWKRRTTQPKRTAPARKPRTTTSRRSPTWTSQSPALSGRRRR